MNPDENVSKVAVKQGDGGIDIYIGELGVDPITVIQCKFFLYTFGDSQKSQIRESFNRAISSDKYDLKEWILCIPRVIDIDEASWWAKWKEKKQNDNKPQLTIKLINGNKLISLMKEHKVYNENFQMEDSIMLKEIHEKLCNNEEENLNQTECIDSTKVLFNVYTKENEQYYFERKYDQEFYESLKINNVWLHGCSGVGKTTTIHRNLLNNNVFYCFCDLSPARINCADDVLSEIIDSIEEKFQVTRDSNERNLIKTIVKLLLDLESSQTVIVVDELAQIDEELLKSIANDFMRIVTSYTNKADGKDLVFVISTIFNPCRILRNGSKAMDYFQFLNLEKWESDLGELFDMITYSLDLNIVSFREEIVKGASNSPRILKSIIRKIIVNNETDEECIAKIIVQTREEAV